MAQQRIRYVDPATINDGRMQAEFAARALVTSKASPDCGAHRAKNAAPVR